MYNGFQDIILIVTNHTPHELDHNERKQKMDTEKSNSSVDDQLDIADIADETFEDLLVNPTTDEDNFPDETKEVS